MSISEKLTTIRNTLKAIKQAIINKGQTPSGDITTYPDAISGISVVKNQDKTLTKNGAYTADDGYTGLGKVTVNVPVGVFPSDTKYIRSNGAYDVTDYAEAYVDVPASGFIPGTFTGVPREILDGVLRYPTTDFVLSLPSDVTTLGDYAFQNSFVECQTLTSVDLHNITTINTMSLHEAFAGCRCIASVDLSGLKKIGYSGLEQAFVGCEKLSSLSFPSLTSDFTTDRGCFYSMLEHVTGCTVHFPSNLESEIGSWGNVTNGFGGTNTVVLFDLDPTE